MCLQEYLSFHLAYNYNFVCISTQKVKSKRIKLYLHTTLSILHSEFPSLFVCLFLSILTVQLQSFCAERKAKIENRNQKSEKIQIMRGKNCCLNRKSLYFCKLNLILKNTHRKISIKL